MTTLNVVDKEAPKLLAKDFEIYEGSEIYYFIPEDRRRNPL